MSNLPVNCSSFDLNKEKIKKFSADLPRPIKLNAVDEKRFFFFDHNVTGKEFNSLIQDLQKALRDSNEVDRKIIKEFASIYNTFESLDKGYIQGICASVASADEASQQALAASEKARIAQEQINITLKVLQDTVEKNQEKFTAIDLELEQQKELSAKAFADVEGYKTQIAAQSKTIQDLNGKIDESAVAYKATIAELNKKIKYAYIISAIAVVIACVNFFVK